MSRMQRALQLRYALVEMTIRYGSSKQRMAYAEGDGNVDKAKASHRAAKRQFAAIQRLASALADLGGSAR